MCEKCSAQVRKILSEMDVRVDADDSAEVVALLDKITEIMDRNNWSLVASLAMAEPDSVRLGRVVRSRGPSTVALVQLALASTHGGPTDAVLDVIGDFAHYCEPN